MRGGSCGRAFGPSRWRRRHHASCGRPRLRLWAVSRLPFRFHAEGTSGKVLGVSLKRCGALGSRRSWRSGKVWPPVGVCEIARKRHRLDVRAIPRRRWSPGTIAVRVKGLDAPPIGVPAIGGIKTASPRGHQRYQRNGATHGSRVHLQRFPCFPIMRGSGLPVELPAPLKRRSPAP